MKAKYSPQLQKELNKIHKINSKLSERIEKQVALFKEDPKHPSLRTHKLSGTLKKMWSISITSGIRMVYIVMEADEALFVKIGSHDEVYSK